MDKRGQQPGKTISGGQPLDAVTGAFSYTGKYIARRLLDAGRHVRTLTNHPDPNSPPYTKLEAAPYNFDRPGELVRSLTDVQTLYVTYWVRFPYKGVTFEKSVRNTTALFNAAREAGVNRMAYG